jgi:hypothetical protein
MLASRLHERGLLASTEQSKRSTLTVRRTLEGRRRSVLHFHSDALLPAADAQHSTGDNPTSPTTHPTSGQAPTHGPQGASGRVGQSGQEGEEASRSAADADQLSLSATPPPITEADQPDQPAQVDPCPYPEHRDRDWTSTSGIRVCGVCHPPATPDVVAQDAPGTTTETP